MAVDLKPTESMANNAKRGLELRKKHGKGGTSVGVARARDISNRKDMSPETVSRMVSYFARHDGNQSGRCWEGYEPVEGKKPYSDGSCRPE